MARVLAAALLLAALPALLAAPAPIPSEPTISDIIDDNNGIQFKWVPAINSTAATMTCDVACGRQGNGWASVSGGAPNRTLCTFTNGTSVLVGTAQRLNTSYVCQYRASSTAKSPVSVNGRRGFTCGCAYACAGADYEYDWNYDNNGTPGGKPKPGTALDYESTKCRKTFWNVSPAAGAKVGPKCNCASGCVCRVRIGTTGKNYIMGWMAKGASSCITHQGARPLYDIFFQCRPTAKRA